MSQTRTLFALLVGIDNYINLSNLSGCVQDVIVFEEFLNTHIDNAQFDLSIKKLTNREATKAQMVHAIDC